MKYVLLLMTLCCFQVCCAKEKKVSVSAKKEGDPYVAHGIRWQKASIEGDLFKVTAVLPGEVRCGFENNFANVQSTYKHTQYWFETEALSDQTPPPDYESFVKLHPNQEGKYRPLRRKIKGIRYGLEYRMKENGIPLTMRIFVTKKKVYLLGAKGKDLSLLESFTNSFSIEKEQ